MYKVLELNQRSIMEVFRSMGAVKLALDPGFIGEINLNYETSRNALDSIEANIKEMEENSEILKPTILELVLYEIDLTTLPESVTQKIRDQIPAILLNQ
ncbi:MAG: hypothetical protein WC865_08950 [Bacteroidales bacterium]